MVDLFVETLFEADGVRAFCVSPKDLSSSPEACKNALRRLAVIPVQTHSLNVAVTEDSKSVFESVDGLVSFTPGIAVGVLTADCVPVLLHSSHGEAVAAVHAGWRGTLGGIICNAIDLFVARGISPEDIKAFIGPSISKEIYEVDRDLAARFENAGFGDYISYPYGKGNKPHIDLKSINRHWLIERGVRPENIVVDPACTFLGRPSAGHIYPSHRRSGGSLHRMLTAISILEQRPSESAP